MKKDDGGIVTTGRLLRLDFVTSGEKACLQDIYFRAHAAGTIENWTKKHPITVVPIAVARCFLEYAYWSAMRPDETFLFRAAKENRTIKAAFYYSTKKVTRACDEVFTDGKRACFRKLWKEGTTSRKPRPGKAPNWLIVASDFIAPGCVEIYRDGRRLLRVSDAASLLKQFVKDFIPLRKVAGSKNCLASTEVVPVQTISERRVSVPRKPDFPIIGREKVIEEGIQAVMHSQLVTAHAFGHSGKTCVIEEIARHFAETQKDTNVIYVDLDYLSSAEEVAGLVQKELGLPALGEEKPQVELAKQLEALGKTILILDNFEQVKKADEVAASKEIAEETVDFWLRKTTQLRLLVGSRTPLPLPESRQTLLPIPNLEAPRLDKIDALSVAELQSYTGVQLFLSYAERYTSEVSPNDLADLRAAAVIVSRVRGHAGTIAKAAIRLKVDALATLSRRYSRRFADSDGALDFALGQLFEMLNPSERVVLLQLARYEGGFAFESVLGVVVDIDGNAWKEKALLHALQHIAELNLIKYSKAENRFEFLAPVEEWAEELWRNGGYVPAAVKRAFYQRFTDYFCGIFEEANKVLKATVSIETIAKVAVDRYNLFECHRQAADHADAKTSFRAVLAAVPLLSLDGPGTLLKELLQGTLKFEGELETESLAEILKEYSRCLFALGDYEGMQEPSIRSVALLEGSENHSLKLHCLTSKAELFRIVNPDAKEGKLWKKLRSEFLRLDDIDGYGDLSRELARIDDIEGHPERGISTLEEAISVYAEREIHTYPEISSFSLARVFNSKGILEWHAGQPKAAAKSLLKALKAFQLQTRKVWIAGALTNLGFVSIDLEEFDEARSYLERAEKAHVEAGNRGWKSVNDAAFCRLLCRAGRFQEAIVHAEGVIRSVEAVRYYENIFLLRSIYGIALDAVGRLDDAYACLKVALAEKRKGLAKLRRHFETYVVATDVALRLGKLKEARSWLRAAEKLAVCRKMHSSEQISHYRRVYSRFLEVRAKML